MEVIVIIISIVIGFFIISNVVKFYARKRDRELISSVTSLNRGTNSEKSLVLQLLKKGIPSGTLLHDHVFKIQKFHSNPQKLWLKFIPMLNVIEIKQLIGDGHNGVACKKIIVSFFYYPIGMIKYILIKLIKRF